MNYYNPYYYMMPMSSSASLGRGLLGGALRGGINWGTLLNGAQRTLGLVNQAIPLVKQAAPMVRNAKTMFKVMNEFKKVDAPKVNDTAVSNEVNKQNFTNEENANDNNDLIVSNGGPTFFV